MHTDTIQGRVSKPDKHKSNDPRSNHFVAGPEGEQGARRGQHVLQPTAFGGG